jgi:hypothetical protein
MRPRSRPTGLLVASSGGHLLQVHHLSRGLPEGSWVWVTADSPDANDLLHGERVVHAYHPTNRNVLNLIRNVRLALRIVRATRPDVVISTGAGVAVPFCWIGRACGARVIYIESFARTTALSLTGRLVYPVAHSFYVQWPRVARGRRRARYVGALFGEPGAVD